MSMHSSARTLFARSSRCLVPMLRPTICSCIAIAATVAVAAAAPLGGGAVTTLSMQSDHGTVRPGDRFVVRASTSVPEYPVVGVQIALHFDSSFVQVVELAEAPELSGTFFELGRQISNTDGTILWSAATLGTPLDQASALMDVTFEVAAGAPSDCDATEHIRFEAVGAIPTRLSATESRLLVPAQTGIPTLAIDSDAPVVLNYKSARSVAASGLDCSATVPEFTSFVIASDNCSGALAITQSPAAGTSVVGLGTHAVTISVRDAAGNLGSVLATLFVTGNLSDYYLDGDLDGYGAVSAAMSSCSAPPGYIEHGGDCDDANPAVHPGATEVCNGIDDDCVGGADNGLTFSDYYDDLDGDGFGWLGSLHHACAPVAGTATNSTDCNDNDASIYPTAVEHCANLGTDNDCDGDTSAAEAIDSTSYFVDFDSDSYGYGASTVSCVPIDGSVTNNTDCDDTRVMYADIDGDTYGAGAPVACGVSSPDDCNDRDNTVYPGAIENCVNFGTDNDCDGDTSAAEALDSTSYFVDADSDGYGAGSATKSCTAMTGGVTNNTDCNDANAAVHPGASEVCNGLDDDCVGGVDNGLTFTNYYADIDGDGFGWLGSAQSACAPIAGRVTNSSDCNDNDANIRPGALELCANLGTDNNCNGDAADVDANAADKVLFYRDQDNDTYTLSTGASFCPDTAQDGYRPSMSSAIDCNDSDPAVHPGVTEVCDGIDADCDGIAETDYNQDGTFDCGPLLEMVAMSQAVHAGDTLIVRVHQHASPAPVNGVQLVMHFDQTRLRLDDIALVAGGPYELEVGKSVDNTTGRARYGAYTLASGVTAAVDVAVLTFTVTAPTSECLATGLLRFEPDGLFRTACSVVDGTVLVPPTSDLAAIAIDGIAPVIVSYSTSASVVASADCTATVPDLASSVVATDNCTIASITQSPAAGTSVGLGATTVTITVTDAAGNSTTRTATFIVTGSSVSYYADADSDGYGYGASTVSCAPIAGSVTNNTDCNDANPAVHPSATEVCNGIDDDCVGGADNGLAFSNYYTDADHDGYGAISASAQSACTQPTGSAPNNTDCNDANSAVHPGATELCGDGLDNNCSGQVDEGCAPFTATMTPSVAHPVRGETLTVRLSSTTPPAGPALTGAQFAVHFDPSRLQLASASPVAGGPFQTELGKLIDNAAGTLRYAMGVTPGQQGTSSQAELADLTFTVRPDAQLCGTASLVWFEPVGPFTTRFSRAGGAASLVPVLVSLPAIALDVIAPVFAGLPSDADVPTDAGSTYGAFVSLPTVTALDECDGAVAVVATGIPANGVFPLGSTTVTWTAVDAAGNTASASRTVTVEPYQLLDVGVCFQGSLPAGAVRQVRVRAGGATVLAPVVLAPQSGQSCGTADGVHVPVSAGYACIEVKDALHSLTDSAPATVAGVRYSASVVLKQGDSNDDDMVDIVDFGMWVDDFGGPRAADARSNFNSDLVVNNGDFSFISVNFFHVGESCTGALAGAHPRDRVSVKQLRREGLGRLESADINRDGWVDAVDVQMFMQGRRGSGAPQRADVPREAGGVTW